MTQEPVRTKTYAFSLYPDDAAVVETLASEQFRYNTSEALRFILRDFRERYDAKPLSAPQTA